VSEKADSRLQRGAELMPVTVLRRVLWRLVPPVPGEPLEGETVRRLAVLGRRYAAGVRVTTFVAVAVVAVLAVGDQGDPTPLAVALVPVGLWSCVYVERVWRCPTTAVTVADAGVLCLLALAQPWIVPESWLTAGRSWVVAFISFAGVIYQYYASTVLGALCVTVLSLGMALGPVLVLLASGTAPGLVTAVWSVVLAALGCLLWTLVMAGARRADVCSPDVEAVRREQALAVKVRANEGPSSRCCTTRRPARCRWSGRGRWSIGRRWPRGPGSISRR
jgi:hypothetical protein